MIEQRDARLDQDQRSEVRIAAADRRRRVHDGGHARIHQPFGGHAIEVLVVDHRDVSRPRTRDEVLRATVDTRDAGLAPSPVRPAARPSGLGRGRVGSFRDWPIRPSERYVPARCPRASRMRVAHGRRGRATQVGSGDVRSAGGGAAGCGCGRQELLRVGDGALAAREAREHPRELVDALVVGQRTHRRRPRVLLDAGCGDPRSTRSAAGGSRPAPGVPRPGARAGGRPRARPRLRCRRPPRRTRASARRRGRPSRCDTRASSGRARRPTPSWRATTPSAPAMARAGARRPRPPTARAREPDPARPRSSAPGIPSCCSSRSSAAASAGAASIRPRVRTAARTCQVRSGPLGFRRSAPRGARRPWRASTAATMPPAGTPARRPPWLRTCVAAPSGPTGAHGSPGDASGSAARPSR